MRRAEVTEDVRPDMTPMIDAVFLLIVFFLCIDFRTLEAKLPADLPKDRGVSRAPATPVEQLPLRIVCDAVGERLPRVPGAPRFDPRTGRANPYLLDGHRVHWTVGPLTVRDADRLARELERIAADPARRVPDPDRPGGRRSIPVVLEPGPGTTYGDVARTLDAVRAAGFDAVSFAAPPRRR